jgi:hypothetical protein
MYDLTHLIHSARVCDNGCIRIRRFGSWLHIRCRMTGCHTCRLLNSLRNMRFARWSSIVKPKYRSNAKNLQLNARSPEDDPVNSRVVARCHEVQCHTHTHNTKTVVQPRLLLSVSPVANETEPWTSIKNQIPGTTALTGASRR